MSDTQFADTGFYNEDDFRAYMEKELERDVCVPEPPVHDVFIITPTGEVRRGFIQGFDTTLLQQQITVIAQAFAPGIQQLHDAIYEAMHEREERELARMMCIDEYHDMPEPAREKHPLVRKIELKSQVAARQVMRQARSRLRSL